MTVNVTREDVVEAVNQLLGGRGADVVIDCAGVPKTVYQTTYLAKPGGTVVHTAIPVDGDQTYSFGQFMAKELTIKSVFRYRNLYPVAITAIADGTINIEQIVTHRFPFAKSKEAFDTVIQDAENVIKGVIEL